MTAKGKHRLVYSSLPSPPAGDAARPTSKPIVRLEKKGRGGKTVTVVERLRLSDDALRTLLKSLQRACGTGGTVKDRRIELQGDRTGAVKAYLQSHHPAAS